MLGFCLAAPLGDALAKLLYGALPLGMLILARFLFQAVILAPMVAATHRPWRVRGRVLRLVVWRTVLHILGIGMMFTALGYLPLADAVAIAFVMPFIMLLLGKYVLNEQVGPRRLIACVVGFIGTLLVIQPSFAAVGWPAMLPLGVAVVFALFMLATRQIAKETDPISLQAVSGTIATVALLPLMVIGHMLEWPGLQLAMPTAEEAWLIVAIGSVGTLAHLMMTWSLRYAPSTTLAPMQYLEIPFATAIGWLIFADLPNGLAAIGILITLAAGLYIILREQATQRMQRSALQQTPPAPPAAE
ncbi:carboxylate/amino acid/amine transporter [Thalassovita autumnalis]|uniref:Carboxylate/amino acid/amine transporter n=2 Tax=Thalassovita autumnalis TaxID=2072972 RepID=A0A0P1G3U1_9RHOB|nr:carboxylate/amino acid/amine transporter [Thalassovita autumnalis]CUH73424.1 carboxylate/amino acid/amine transporter [Thalassovita autumnalis]